MLLPHALPSHGIPRSLFEGDPELPRSVTIAFALLAVFVTGVTLILLGLA